jgi:imidazole glycerol-phosphate synthase subunit HisH
VSGEVGLRRGGRVVVVDYGVSNLFSVCNALESLGAAPLASNRPEDLSAADRVLLPGVGAFGKGMANLRDLGLDRALRDFSQTGKPLLGICLGMQLLADESLEHGRFAGLGLIPGSVVRLAEGPGVRVPHIGWNAVRHQATGWLWNKGGVADFYFVHSYHFVPADEADAAGWCEHGGRFVAAVARGATVGVQFHPEKSHRAGLETLKSFLDAAPC